MKRCENCGILFDDNLRGCPLCGSAEEGSSDPGKPGEVLKASRRESVKYAWELIGIVCLSGVFITLLLDIVFSKGISWSLYPVTSISWVWLALTIIVFISRWPFAMLMLLLADTLAMLVLFNLFDNTVNWFVPVAMPVTIVLFILAGIVVWLARRARRKGFNILAIYFMAANILCIAIEVFSDLNLYGAVTIRWSAVVSAALIPVSSVLMFIHYRLKRGQRLDSFFHI